MSKVTRRFFITEIEAKVVNRESETIEVVKLVNISGDEGKKLDKWVEKNVHGVLLKYSVISVHQEIRVMSDEVFYLNSDYMADER